MTNVIPFPKPPKKRRRALMVMLEADLGEVKADEAREARNRIVDCILEAVQDQPEEIIYSARVVDVVDVH